MVGIEENVIGGKCVANHFKLSLKLTLSEISEDLISITDNSFCKCAKNSYVPQFEYKPSLLKHNSN